MVRIYKRLTKNNLIQMREFALAELDRFLYRSGSPRGKYQVYDNRLITICLCQGAAQHYAQSQPLLTYDRTVHIPSKIVRQKGYRLGRRGRVLAGIKDIDFCFFFHRHPEIRIPDINNCRKHIVGSFDRLGDCDLDFMKKTISDGLVASAKSGRPTDIIRSYLRNAHTLTSNCWAEASVVGLYPNPLFGRLIWRVEWLC